MRFTLFTSFALVAGRAAVAGHNHNHQHIHQELHQRQIEQRDFFSQLASIFNGPPDPPSPKTTTAKPATLIPPATATMSSASSSPTTSAAIIIVTRTGRLQSTISSTSTDSSTSTSSSTTTSSSSSSTSTPTPTPTPIPMPLPSATSAPQNQQSSGNGISGGGIAAAVILSLFIFGIACWVLFRYHPKSRTWWAARKERKFKERSYRDAIDGPGSSNLRSRALGGDGGMRAKSAYLASFFTPRTAKMGDGTEIRRKPVQWGAKSGHGSDGDDEESGHHGSGVEKVALTQMASPMGKSPPTTYAEMPAEPATAHTPTPVHQNTFTNTQTPSYPNTNAQTHLPTASSGATIQSQVSTNSPPIQQYQSQPQRPPQQQFLTRNNTLVSALSSSGSVKSISCLSPVSVHKDAYPRVQRNMSTSTSMTVNVGMERNISFDKPLPHPHQKERIAVYEMA